MPAEVLKVLGSPNRDVGWEDEVDKLDSRERCAILKQKVGKGGKACLRI